MRKLKIQVNVQIVMLARSSENIFNSMRYTGNSRYFIAVYKEY